MKVLSGCDGDSLQIQCPPHTVVVIEGAVYGRTDTTGLAMISYTFTRSAERSSAITLLAATLLRRLGIWMTMT